MISDNYTKPNYEAMIKKCKLAAARGDAVCLHGVFSVFDTTGKRAGVDYFCETTKLKGTVFRFKGYEEEYSLTDICRIREFSKLGYDILMHEEQNAITAYINGRYDPA